MKYFQKIWTIFLSVALCSTSIAQVHTITFTGKDWTNQYHIPLHHVTVFNLDQLWEEVLYYPDTTLVLGTVGVDSYNVQDVQLMQNVPNPFDGITEFALVLPEGGDVQMEIYDIAGRLAVGRHFSDLQAGTHLFQTTLASPQTYLLSAKVEGGQMTIKMVNEGHGAGNTIQHLGMTNLQGDFTLYLKNDKYSGGYPFSVGDEMKYTGYVLIDGGMKESNIIQCHQNNNDTYTLQFDVTAPTVTTASANSIMSYSAVCGGNVTISGGSPVVARGVCWSTSHNPTLSNSHAENGIGLGSYTCSITGLTTGTTYYVRAYATNGVGTAYGSEKSFTTLSLPTVTTNTVTNITGVTATSGGQVTSDGGDYVTARGVCWSTSQNPTVSGSHTTNGNGTGSFTSNITGLSTGTTYYVRAYATNSVGTAYGEQRTFTTTTLPTVTTNTVSSVTNQSAICGGNVTFGGYADVIARGICWSTSQNPTINNNHTYDGTGTGAFSSVITGLTANTTYYVRAYATNSAGTAYGPQRSFTTLNLPIVMTNTVSNISTTTATCGGNVTSAGSATVTSRGVCWSTSSNPTVSDSHTTNGSGTGSFTSNITGLTAGTTYYVRAYATSSVGTAYGTQRSFTTLTLPAVTTNTVSNITATSATCGGNVTSSGGANVTAKGVCWSTTQNPTVSNSHTTNGSGTGSFTSSMSNLTPNTTYYVRAYATNDAGTAYGEQRTFTTNTTTPTVTTKVISNITTTSATCGGNVSSTGGSPVTARGVCWSTSQNPTINDNHTLDGNGTGTFTSLLNNLTVNETYYVRAYATNSNGTAYGTQRSFTTPTMPTVITDAVSNLTGTSVTCNGNVTASGNATVTERGFCWDTIPNPTVSSNHIQVGTGTGAFSYNLSDLESNTVYYLRSYATNVVGTAYGNQVSFNTPYGPCAIQPILVDYDGNIYNTIQIGDQCWMKENLRVTHFDDGTPVPAGDGSSYSSTVAYRYCPDNDSINVVQYGYLYNWKAMMNGANFSSTNPSGVQGVCPTGWHVPSYAEWMQLKDCVENQAKYQCDTNNNSIVKALSSVIGWLIEIEDTCAGGYNTITNNSTGFSAMPSGGHSSSGWKFGEWAYYGSTSLSTLYTDRYNAFVLYYNSHSIYQYHSQKGVATSVRCVRDNTNTIMNQYCPGVATVTDYDGNVYKTIKIGEQCWMRENLRTTHYANGASISLGSDTSTSVAYRYYPNNSSYNVSTYGYLYNWKAVMRNATSSNANPSGIQGVCPAGWHVPSHAEWTQLTNYISGQDPYTCGSTSGYIAKSLASTTGWTNDTTACAVGNAQSDNNSSLFGALPAGWHGKSAFQFGTNAWFWSSTQNASGARGRGITYNSATVAGSSGNYYYLYDGFSVRCVYGGDYLPTVSTEPVSSITITSAVSGGNVVESGSSAVTARGVCWSTSPNPTVDDNHTTNGSGAGSFTSNISGLSFGVVYYVRAYATNSVGTAYGETFIMTPDSCGIMVVSDYDGNTYNTVKIGNQCWMKENLRTTHYADGVAISVGNSNTSATTGYYYDYSSSGMPLSQRGYLYNWKAVMRNASSSNANPSGVQGVCPTGWHVPSDVEWTQLENYVSSQSQYVCGSDNTYIAKALASTIGWNSYTENCTVGNDQSSNNATVFSAVPVGGCYGSSFNVVGNGACFWSSTQHGYQAWFRDLYYNGASVDRDYNLKENGRSVRCLRN